MIFPILLILKKSLMGTKNAILSNGITKLKVFKFYNLDSSGFSNQDIPAGKSIYIVYFDPDCDFCESEISLIMNNISQFKQTEILMVSSNSPDRIRRIGEKFNISHVKTVHLLWDKDIQFQTLFGKSIIPSSFVYSPDHVLLKKYEGLVRIEALIKLVNLK